MNDHQGLKAIGIHGFKQKPTRIKKTFKDGATLNTINNQRDIISNQGGTDKAGRVFEIPSQNPRIPNTLFVLQFNPQFIGRNKGDFNARKEGRANKGDENDQET